MKLIAHRGLVHGPNKDLENNPKQIAAVLKMGYDAEIDLWYVNGDLMLGHDGPQYPVAEEFLSQCGLWIHAKNLAALRWLTKTQYNYFWHQEDDFTLTSHGYIWTYPGRELTMRSIQVMPEWNDPELKNINWLCWGICSDWVERIQAQRPKSL